MYHFVTWIIEYSDDDRVARSLFILALPILLVLKLVLRVVDGIRSLTKRRDRVPVFVVPSEVSSRVGY